MVIARTNGVVGITPRLSGMLLGGKDIRGCKNMPPEWRKLYMGIVQKRPWKLLRSLVIRKECQYLLMRKKRMQKNFINERRRQSGQRGTMVQFPQNL